MSALPEQVEEYCPSCGLWVSFLQFNYDSGWYKECSGHQAQCIHCGTVLQGSDVHRTTCRICRQELWLDRYGDDIEFLMTVKGYSYSQARITLTKLVRPICQHCRKPIKGAQAGALFHKRTNDQLYAGCHTAYLKFKSLQKSGLTDDQALARLKNQPPRETTVLIHIIELQ